MLPTINYLLIALDAHMFSDDGYEPGTNDQSPSAAGPGPGTHSFWASGPGPGSISFMAEHMCLKCNQQPINRHYTNM